MKTSPITTPDSPSTVVVNDPPSKLSFLFWQTLYQGYTLWGNIGSTLAGAINGIEHCLYQQMVWGKSPEGGVQTEWKAFQTQDTRQEFQGKVRSWVPIIAIDVLCNGVGLGPLKEVSNFVVDRGAYLGGHWVIRSVWPYTGQPVFAVASKIKALVTSPMGKPLRIPTLREKRLFRAFQFALRGVSLAVDAVFAEHYFLLGFLNGQIMRYNRNMIRSQAKYLEKELGEGEDSSGWAYQVQKQFVEVAKQADPITPMDQEMADFMAPDASRTGLVAAKITGLVLPLFVRAGIDYSVAGLKSGSALLVNGRWVPACIGDNLPIAYLRAMKDGAKSAGTNVNKRVTDGLAIGLQPSSLERRVTEEVGRINFELREKTILKRIGSWLTGYSWR